MRTGCAIRDGSGTLIGGIGLHRGEQWASHRTEIGYWLGRPYWGQGIMTQVVRAVIRHAFEQLALTKLTAAVYAFNHASARVLEKCGFVEEGLLHRDLLKDGQLIDLRLFGLLR
jgi:RimJ/RimL family protein N-acetyltransferase